MENIKQKVNVKDIIKGTTANFDYAAGQKIYYKIITEGNTYLFPVDLSDTEDIGTTKFEATYKSITLLRYLNKAIKSDELVVYPTI